MPIVQVSALPQHPGVDIEAVALAIALAVSGELGDEPSGTWVTWQTLDSGRYREGESVPPPEQPPATHPPIARVSAFEGRPHDVVTRVLSAVARTLVDELGLEAGNAFVVWDELRAGRVHTGGTMPGT